jgi:PPOX class probable F420-dependent enzyme
MFKRISVRSVSALRSPQDHDRPGFWAYLRLRHRNAGSRMSAAFDYFLLRIRHRDAWSSDSEGAETIAIAPGHGFESLRGHKYCLLTTFRKSGEPIPTPVWFGLADGKAYIGSDAAAAKVKRIRSNPRVRVAPCSPRGKPLGSPVEGRARILAPNESERAEQAIAANTGLFRKLLIGVGNRLEVDVVRIEIDVTGQKIREAP